MDAISRHTRDLVANSPPLADGDFIAVGVIFGIAIVAPFVIAAFLHWIFRP